ncbi:MAG TPA: divalent-cation tolerance protein CutA [Acidobacteriaceae bacterium]|nr:divalent-cation tolerance protein CutA [Acidobacteriaceae bacterium]
MMLPTASSVASPNAPMIVPATEARLILTTAPSHREAERIARALVDDRLAACVSILPDLTSVYRWKGDVESAAEILLLIKSTAGNLDRLEEALRRLHSYEVPEFLVLTPESSSKPYLDWLIGEAGPPK